VKVFLFLLDPVKGSGLGTDFYNREIHSNVKEIQIIAMEDLHNNFLYDAFDLTGKQGFKMLPIMRNMTGVKNYFGTNPRQAVEPNRYIRMPGKHGTGSQVDGHPTGQLTFELARRFIIEHGGEAMRSPCQKSHLCELYFQIIEENPVTRVPVNKLQAIFGKTTLSRKVNDNFDGENGNFTHIATDSRAKALDKLGVTNHYRGHKYYVNEHHAALVKELYPSVHRHVGRIDQEGGIDKHIRRMGNTNRHAKKFKYACYSWDYEKFVWAELRRMKSVCQTGYRLFETIYCEVGRL
jgi:hypothetical protein